MSQSAVQPFFNPLTKDIIIGSIVNYYPKDVSCWINSILMSGFNGDVIVINFGCPRETIDYLQDRGVKCYDAELNGLHIVVQRFFMMWKILHLYNISDYRCVFASDVRDVIFQKNPSSRFLHTGYQNAGILAATENIRYRDEEWGNNNLRVSYPHLYGYMKDQLIYCAGFITGEIELFRDMCLHIYHLSLIGGDPQPDQAAYNILINMRPALYNTHFTEEGEAWCVNLGTSLGENAVGKNEQFLFDPPPIVKGDTVYNFEEKEYYVVHQYDRVPGLKQLIENKFGNLTLLS